LHAGHRRDSGDCREAAGEIRPIELIMLWMKNSLSLTLTLETTKMCQLDELMLAGRTPG